MHITAMENGKQFVEQYLDRNSPLEVLDVGSFDVNGSLRPLFEESTWEYVGLDCTGGPEDNVDSHLNPDGTFPFLDDSFDVVVSSSCLEHDQVFWRTFEEMIRVTRPGGLIYLLVPSKGGYHGYPGDCWRFMEDAYPALAKAFPEVELLEHHITATGNWGDNVGVFAKKVL